MMWVMSALPFEQRFGISSAARGDVHARRGVCLTREGMILEHRGGIRAVFLPCVRVDGVWHRPSRDTVTVDGDTLLAPLGELGVLEVELEGDLFAVRFEARAACEVEAIGVEGIGHVEGASAWLSNGFQSWSQSGVIALGSAPSAPVLESALRMHGDLEMIRGGAELSWWYTYVGGGAVSLFLGALTARTFRTHVNVARADAGLTLRLISGGSGERVSAQAGQSVWSECFCVEGGRDLHAMLRRYGETLPSRRRTQPRQPRVGWMSWYELWDDGLNAEAVFENAKRARPLLDRLTSRRGGRPEVIVDDGWQKNWGDWEPNEKFPMGLDGLSRRLADDGFATGVWLAPFVAHEASMVFREHPDWFVEGALYMHAKRGPMHVLDVTHPDAAAHLAAVIRRIVSWGYHHLKIDFLFAGTLEGKRQEHVTGIEAYRRGLEIIRDAAGKDTFIVAVGAPVLGTFEHVDAYRVGFDIAIEALGPTRIGPSWVFVANQARSLASRFFLSHATLLDADPTLLRTLSRTEVDAAALLPALAGGALFLSDDLRVLPEERVRWGLQAELAALALGGVAAEPEQLFVSTPPPALGNPVMEHLMGKNEHRVPLVWRLADGRRVALNVSSDPAIAEGELVEPHTSRWLGAT